jgi:hypothetical protein
MQFPMATVKKNALYMRDKYDLFSTTIGKNLVFNKLKECMQKLKFNDSKCSLGSGKKLNTKMCIEVFYFSNENLNKKQ